MLKADIMTLVGEYNPLLWSSYGVVARKVGVRRTYNILKTKAHKHRALDAVREVLDVEIAESLVEVLVGYSLLSCSLENRLARPVDDLEIVLVVSLRKGTDGAIASMR